MADADSHLTEHRVYNKNHPAANTFVTRMNVGKYGDQNDRGSDVQYGTPQTILYRDGMVGKTLSNHYSTATVQPLPLIRQGGCYHHAGNLENHLGYYHGNHHNMYGYNHGCYGMHGYHGNHPGNPVDLHTRGRNIGYFHGNCKTHQGYHGNCHHQYTHHGFHSNQGYGNCHGCHGNSGHTWGNIHHLHDHRKRCWCHPSFTGCDISTCCLGNQSSCGNG